jgi:hypothetical protein
MPRYKDLEPLIPGFNAFEGVMGDQWEEQVLKPLVLAATDYKNVRFCGGQWLSSAGCIRWYETDKRVAITVGRVSRCAFCVSCLVPCGAPSVPMRR